MKARDVSAATAGRYGTRRSMILVGAAVAFACAAAFAALLGTGASSAGADPACSNEAIRAQQHATQLPDCRAFERVTPADKGGGDIIGEGLSTMASAAGDAAAFESRLGFGDTVGSGAVGRTTYLARRGAGGWSTHSITPVPRPDAVQVGGGQTRVEILADDLSNAFVWAYDLPAVSDDAPLLENLYAEDTSSGALRTVSKTQQNPLRFFDFRDTEFAGYSADAKHIAFLATTQMLPTATAPGYPQPEPFTPNLYKWDDGVLSLAGTLPNGSVPPAGATVYPRRIGGTMSLDGSRLVFNASPDGIAPPQLYLHVDGKPSVWVSEPEMSDQNDKTPRNGIFFEGMTPDANNFFFVSDGPLVDADTAPGPDLYRFTYSADPASDPNNLTLITNDGKSLNDPTIGGALVGMSDDARRVYVHDTDGALKLWQEGVPGLTTVEPSGFATTSTDLWITLLATGPGNGRVSPDGNWLAYINQSEMYLYDRRAQELTCVSCPIDASIVPAVTHTGVRDYYGFRPRFLTPDGKVFFTSTGSLVPEDTNDVADVYEYDGQTGTLSLLSSGKGRDPAMFADASRSGDDVLILTRSQLVNSDRDENVDLYDVRTGGGFDEPESLVTAPCAGESCQAPSGPAAAPAIRSGATARGNPRRRRVHCAANQRKVQRSGKVRCVKKQKRHAHTNRRAAR